MRWRRLQKKTIEKHIGAERRLWVSVDWRYKIIDVYGFEGSPSLYMNGFVVYRQRDLVKGPENLGLIFPQTEEEIRVAENWVDISDHNYCCGLQRLEECTEAVEEYERRNGNA